MKHVRLVLDAGGREAEFHPMYDLMANGYAVERAETVHVNYTGDSLGIMHYVAGDREGFRAAIEAIDGVHEFELSPVDDAHFYAHLQCAPGNAAVLFDAITQESLIRVPPMVFRSDGSVAISLVGTAAEIQAVVEDLPDAVDVTIEEVTGVARATDAPGSLLSDRQAAAIEAALAMGYYEVPRRASHEDVAGAIDCAPSTAAEHLRKAESKLLRAAFEEPTPRA